MRLVIVGMMSGTSTDGIDAVVVQFGELGNHDAPAWKILHHLHLPFASELRQEILACLRADTGTVDRICALNFDLGEIYANAALQALRAAGLEPSQVDLIGNHGQTVWHIPQHST